MKKFVLMLLLLLCGCAAEPNSNLISPESSPAWLMEATELSVVFWADKGVEFEIGEGGLLIQARDTSPNWGFYEQVPFNHIEVSTNATSLNLTSRSCIISHELGHHLGQEHVSQDVPSLMNAIITICADPNGNSKCCWSDLDEVELERALK